MFSPCFDPILLLCVVTRNMTKQVASRWNPAWVIRHLPWPHIVDAGQTQKKEHIFSLAIFSCLWGSQRHLVAFLTRIDRQFSWKRSEMPKILPYESEQVKQMDSHHWMVGQRWWDKSSALHRQGSSSCSKCLQWMCQRESYCLNQMRRTILTWKISSWVFGVAVANWEIELRLDRDGSTSLGRFYLAHH